MAWRDLKSTKFAPHYTTFHKTFRKWTQLKVFETAYKTLLRLDAVKRRRGAKHYCIDSTLVKNQYGKDCLGRNPTDRGRKGMKLSAIVDDRGIPLALAAFGANVSDYKTVEPTFRQKLIPLNRRRLFFADKGYDSQDVREYMSGQGLRPRVAKRGTKTPRVEVSARACVENLFGWLDKHRRLLMRFDALVDSYLQLTFLACCHILGRRQTMENKTSFS
jgi:putative transposase